MIHNVVVVDGKEYKAVSEKEKGTCEECCAEDFWLCAMLDCSENIFKPHYKLNHNSEV